MGNACGSPAPEPTPATAPAAAPPADSPAPAPVAASAPAAAAPAPTADSSSVAPAAVTVEMSAAAAATVAPKAKIAIVYYSMYGHISKMAAEVAKGIEAAGAEVQLYQVPETLPAEVLTKMYAAPKDANVPTITDPTLLEQYDGIIFGVPTRFGMMAAQMKAFFDSTGGLWAKGGLAGKTAGIFFSTGTQNGGQETTAFTSLTQFTHHGMIFVPIGYTDPSLFNMDEIHGGSPYGAGTLAGPKGDRQPSALELGVALHQGNYFATITSALKRGRASK